MPEAGSGTKPEKQGLMRVGDSGVWLHSDRAAGFHTTPVRPAQLPLHYCEGISSCFSQLCDVWLLWGDISL